MQFHVHKDDAGLWRWTLTAANGVAIAISPGGFGDKKDCLYALDLVRGASRRTPAGPAKRDHKLGERVALSLRMTPDLKRRLDSAAEEGGRSQSQEAEIRLERTFDRQDLLPDVLTLAYGEVIAGILMMLGYVMKDTAQAYDRPPSASDLTPLKIAIQAALALLIALRPGDATEPTGVGAIASAHGMLNALRSQAIETRNRFSSAAETIKKLLGPAVAIFEHTPSGIDESWAMPSRQLTLRP